MQIEDVEYISDIVLKEIVSQVRKKKDVAMENLGTDELVYKIEVATPIEIFRKDKENVCKICIEEECAEKILKCVEKRLAELGLQFFNGSELVYEGKGKVFFRVSICGYELESVELQQLVREEKWDEKLWEWTILGTMFSLIFVLAFIDQILTKINSPYVVFIPIVIAGFFILISCIVPVKWKLKKIYYKKV